MTNHDKAQHFVFRPTEPGGIDNEIFRENMDEIRKRLNLMSLCLEKLDPELQKLGFNPVEMMSVTQKLRIANLVTAVIDAFRLQGPGSTPSVADEVKLGTSSAGKTSFNDLKTGSLPE